MPTNEIPVYTIDIPEYQIATEPDDKAIGKIVDEEIKKHYMGQSIIVRGIASSEHNGKTVDEVIEIISQTGTDRYKPNKAGDRYENIEGKNIDLFAVPATISQDSEVFHVLVWGFYHSAIAVHGYPVHIDVISIYDA